MFYNLYLCVQKYDVFTGIPRSSTMRDTKKVVLHKGLDNTVHFRVRNADLKKVNMAGETVIAKIINPENGEKVLEKSVNVSSGKSECLEFVVYEGDLVNLGAGHYKMYLECKHFPYTNNTAAHSATPLYINENGDIGYDVEITGKIDSTPYPTVEMVDPRNTWTETAINQTQYYVSSAIECNAIRNHTNSLHTFAVYGTEFTGKLEIWGSLELDPPGELENWFPVQVMDAPVNVIELENYTGVHPFNIVGNYYWVKFRLAHESGKLDKILWRS